MLALQYSKNFLMSLSEEISDKKYIIILKKLHLLILNVNIDFQL